MTPTPTPTETIASLNSSAEWFALAGGAVGALVGALVAAGLTYVFTRRQTIRAERRAAYRQLLVVALY